MKRRTLFLGVLMLLCAILLAGCGGPAIKTEDEILTDIQDGGYMNQMAVSNDPIETISSMEILKRQTNREDKTDIVYVTAQADTEKVHFVRSMKLIYNLYDDKGWVLDSCENYPEGESSTVPLKGPDESTLDTFFNRFDLAHSGDDGYVKYVSWSIVTADTNLDNGTSIIEINASRKTDIITTNEKILVQARFYSDLGAWDIEGCDVGPHLMQLSYELNINTGSYHASNFRADRSAQLDIYSFDPQSNSILLSVDIQDRGDYSYYGTFTLQRENNVSNPNLDLDNIQETATDGNELNTLGFLRFTVDIGEREERVGFGSDLTTLPVRLKVKPERGYESTSQQSPFSLWINQTSYFVFEKGD